MLGVGWRDLTVRPGGGGGGPGTGLAAIAVVVNLPGRDVWRVIRWRDNQHNPLLLHRGDEMRII